MQQRRVFLAIFMILVVTVIGFRTSYADDFTIWEGKWFKISEKISALQANESGTISPFKYKQTIYIHIFDVDENNGVLYCENYDYRNGKLKPTGPIDIIVSDGSSLDFSWVINVGPEVKDVITGQLAGRITGKIKKGVLASAKIMTVGGVVDAISDDDVPTVLGISWKGSLVRESKVPSLDVSLPTPGEWTALTSFGELNFIVNSTSTGLTKISYNFSDFSCGRVLNNGGITVSEIAPWVIRNSQFTIENSLNGGLIITVSGTFEGNGTNAAGTWEAVQYGSHCSGTWNASPH